MKSPRELQRLYKAGENITRLLRDEAGSDRNSDQMIEIAYDLQTGSYIAGMENPAFADHKRAYSKEIADTILRLCKPATVLEAGVGEATTLSGVLANLGVGVESYGFDLSWSRVAYARGWLKSNGIETTTLCTGNLFHIPFADNSIDVVYTSHSVEPNGGNEAPILKELYRVAAKYVVLLEPGYELASQEARARMESHGYCRNLVGSAEQLGYEVLEHKLFPHCANPLNPTALTILKKAPQGETPAHVLACPRFKTPLERVDGMLFSPEALSVYPVMGGIPCLRPDNAIFASKFKEVVNRA